MRVVVIGAGDAGGQHVEAVQRAEGLDLAAIADIDGAAAAALAARADVPAVSVEDAVSGRLGDALALCIPPAGRVPLALTAIGNGQALVLEKPAALDLAELDLLTGAADNAGVPVAVMHQHRMALLPWLGATTLTTQSAVATCRVSRRRPPAHYLNSPWRSTRARSGGALVAHLAVHYLDLACQVLGEPTAVHGILTADHAVLPEVDTRAVLNVSFSSGAILAAAATTFAGRQEDHLVIDAADGQLEIRGGAVSMHHAGDVRARDRIANPELRAAVYTEVATALQRGQARLPIADVRHARGAVAILEAVRERPLVGRE